MERNFNKSIILKALKHLRASDKIMAALINKHGPCTIEPALNNPLHALVGAIIAQQLSAHAARSIKARLFEAIGSQEFRANDLINLPDNTFQKAGISHAKQKYIIGVTKAVIRGEIDFLSLSKLADEDAINILVAFSGVGRWTAEMFLIFGLGRVDVLSVNDAGLKRAIKQSYNLAIIPSEQKMFSISETWRPYRSIASWYLWRELD